MFKFDLDQLIYYMHDNRIHSAPVVARMLIENAHDDWTSTPEQRDFFTPFGKSCETYSTCHGLVSADEAYASKEDLVASLLSD